MTGREECRMVKEMRRAYVKAEKLDLAIADCNFKGECPGTCQANEDEMLAISRLLVRKAYRNVRDGFDDGFIQTEWMEDARNTEIVVIGCNDDECNIINHELEELGLTECTF